MSKDFYFFAIFFSALAITSSLLSNIIALQFAAQMYMQEAFVGCFLVQAVVSLLASLFILRYYYYRKYWLTFSTAAIHFIGSLCFFIVFFRMLQAGTLVNYYFPALIFYLSAGILYALSLMFSNAGKRLWLKIAGAIFLIIGIILLSALTWNLTTQDSEVKGILEKVGSWTSIVGSLIPVLFIINFLDELKTANKESGQKNLYKLLYVAGSAASAIALVFVISFWSNVSPTNLLCIILGQEKF